MNNEQAIPFSVLMTADTVGGVWTYCMELCATLSEVTFHLVTAGAPLQPDQVKTAASLSNVVLYETTYKLEWMDDPWQDIDASGEWLLQLEQELQPNLVHLNSFAYAGLPFHAPKLVVAHSDVFSWWQSVKGTLPGHEWSEYFSRVKRGLESADLVVSPTRASLALMQQVYGFENETRVVHNGRHTVLFHNGIKQPQVMAMGRMWDEAKNLHLVLEAAPHMQCGVKIAGDLHFENNTTDLGGQSVQYLGRLSPAAVANELATTAVYVLPARYEPFGLSALEAALSGCALVLSSLPTLHELWGDAAMYVEPDDAISLACAVNELVSHPVLLEAMAAKARGRALQFSAYRMGQEYMSLYRTLTKQVIPN